MIKFSILYFILCFAVAFLFWGCMTPIGMYGSCSQTIAGSQDLEMTADGQDTLDVKVSMTPETANIAEGGLGLNVKGVTKVISKGNMVQVKKVGFTKDTNAVFLGGYDKEGTLGTGEAHHITNLSIAEGGGVFHDLLRGWGIREEKANVPEDVFGKSEETDNKTFMVK